jgi:hypothetical protein
MLGSPYSWSNEEALKWNQVFSQHENALWRLAEIESLDPSAITILYFNCRALWQVGSEFISSRNATFFANNWILRYANRSLYSHPSGQYIHVDIGNPDWRAWMVDTLGDYVEKYGIDGIFIDNYGFDTLQFYPWKEEPWNPRTNTYYTDKDVGDAYDQLSKALRDRLGDDKYIIGNCLLNGNRFYNYGSYDEICAYLSDTGMNVVLPEYWVMSCEAGAYDASIPNSASLWKCSIDMAIWLEQHADIDVFTYIQCDNSFFSYYNDGNYPNDLDRNPSNGISATDIADYENFTLFGFASRWLTIQPNGLETWIWFGSYARYDFAQSLLKLDIGNPTGSYAPVSNTNVYSRQFDDGLVLVNPTGSSYSIYVGSGLENALTHEHVGSTITVSAYTAAILKRTQ